MEPLPQDVRLVRRAFWLIRLRWVAITGLCVTTFVADRMFLIGLPTLHAAGRPDPPPNVLLLIVDDLNTFLLGEDDTLLYEHRDRGILGFSETMERPLQFLEG